MTVTVRIVLEAEIDPAKVDDIELKRHPVPRLVRGAVWGVESFEVVEVEPIKERRRAV